MSSKNISENIFPSNKKIQLNPIGPTTPNTLPVPESPIWQVYTTHIVSTVEIWVRLGDENVSVRSYRLSIRLFPRANTRLVFLERIC